VFLEQELWKADQNRIRAEMGLKSMQKREVRVRACVCVCKQACDVTLPGRLLFNVVTRSAFNFRLHHGVCYTLDFDLFLFTEIY
jgi:hypothetical protein